MSAPPPAPRRAIGFDDLLVSQLVRRTKSAELHAVWWPVALLADRASPQYGEVVGEARDQAAWHYRQTIESCPIAFERHEDESDEAFASRRVTLIKTFVRDVRNGFALAFAEILRHVFDPGPLRKSRGGSSRSDREPRRQAFATLLRLAFDPIERRALFDDPAWGETPGFDATTEFVQLQTLIAEAERGQLTADLPEGSRVMLEIDLIQRENAKPFRATHGLMSEAPSIERVLQQLSAVRYRLEQGAGLPSELELRPLIQRLSEFGAIPLVCDGFCILAEVQRRSGGDAEATLRQAITFARDHCDRRGEALASWELGKLLIDAGRIAEGEACCRVQIEYRHAIQHTQVEESERELRALVGKLHGPGATPSDRPQKKSAKKSAKKAPSKQVKRTKK